MIKLVEGVDRLILYGDCINSMKELEDNSVDAIITDPPYGLSFMGKKWDYDVPGIEIWIEALRVLKPGGYLLSFAGTRTYHRMCCNIEDAGFEIRDMISWLYGSGFPKSLNIGKQIDKIQGNEREVVGEKDYQPGWHKEHTQNDDGWKGAEDKGKNLTKGTSPWEGWGTALKPACEPIVVARKPLSEKNVALNVLKWGTGGINIDGCRIGYEKTDSIITKNPHTRTKGTDAYDSNCYGKYAPKEDYIDYTKCQGRFPANIILDEEAGKMLDEQSGISNGGKRNNFVTRAEDSINYGGKAGTIAKRIEHNDRGGASRFFYCAKASKSERNYGCEDFEDKVAYSNLNTKNGSGERLDGQPTGKTKNNHPTVKPIKLMEYLIKLVSKEDSTVLDPFMGSGTTGIACVKLNRKFIGIEREEDYIKIAEARIKRCIKDKKKVTK